MRRRVRRVKRLVRDGDTFRANVSHRLVAPAAVHTGSIGIFGFDERATLNVVIRTLVRCADEYHLRVGAGVVHDSVSDREYAETLDKARALVTAVDEALGGRASLAVEAAAEAAGDSR